MAVEIPHKNLLIESQRGRHFLEITATGLQLHFAVYHAGVYYPELPENCPNCHGNYPAINPRVLGSLPRSSTFGQLFICKIDSGEDAAILSLPGNLLVLARECPSMDRGRQSLEEKARIAQKLLTSFHMALSEGLSNGKKALELSALRQMNHIILSLFGGAEQASTRAFDLILSALVILLDAQGSWLEYRENDREYLLTKGDTATVRAASKNMTGQVHVIEIADGSICGKLGVLAPEDPEQTHSLLPLMVQECLIVFKIGQLFQLLQTRFRQVLGCMGSAIILADHQGTVTFANSAAEKLLQLNMLDLIGKPATTINAPWTPYFLSMAAETAAGRMEPLGDGEYRRWVDWHVYPMLEDDRVAGWLVVVDDRTDYYHWQEVSCRAERFASTATMVGALAHELRNPLAAAKGLMQLMGRKRDPKQVAAYTDLVTREIDRVTQLLNEFLLLGKPAKIAAEPLNMVELLREALPLFEAEAYGSEIDILTEFDDIPQILADSGQIMQVVLNLVRNAIEASDRQGKVALSLRRSPSGLTFEIKDNGPGIPPEIIHKIFEPFFTTKERGTGLGLPVCQAIVYNHGGEISAYNQPNGGAVFSVELPALPDRLDRETDVLISISGDIERYAAEQALRAAGYTILTSNLADSPLAEKPIPAVVLLDETCNGQGLEAISQTWPLAKIIVIGRTGPLPAVQGIEFLRRPLDYAHLISRLSMLIIK
ncbi:MAG: two-component system sensor histidine kinase NtrB [Bacillota bacterium]